MHAASFGDVAELAVAGLIVKVEIVFVCDAPMGWVVRFESNPELVERTRGIAGSPSMVGDLEIEAPVPYEGEPDEVWGEDTGSFEGPPSTAYEASVPPVREEIG